MKYYRNKNWQPGTRPYADCTQLLACEAPDEVSVGENYVECTQEEITHLPHLYTQAGVRYFGYL